MDISQKKALSLLTRLLARFTSNADPQSYRIDLLAVNCPRQGILGLHPQVLPEHKVKSSVAVYLDGAGVEPFSTDIDLYTSAQLGHRSEARSSVACRDDLKRWDLVPHPDLPACDQLLRNK
jgi:hypothetical protein